MFTRSCARSTHGHVLGDLGSSDPGGPRRFDDSGCSMVVGDAVELLRGVETGSIDFVASDPPYNPQLKVTMAGGKLAAAHRKSPHRLFNGLGHTG